MIIRVSQDKEKAMSILKMTSSREKFILTIDKEEYSTILAENYYEIIKELSTALLLLDGFKSVGENAHKDLIDYLKNYNFGEEEIFLMNDLRIKRNKSSYEGKQINPDFLKIRKETILKLIKKLKLEINKKLI